jgi:hypothetical protein
MHWACFHYEFEHGAAGNADPDIACADPSCPARAFDPNPQPPAWVAVTKTSVEAGVERMRLAGIEPATLRSGGARSIP